MKSSNYALIIKDPKRRRACFCGIFPTLLCFIVFFMGCAHLSQDKEVQNEVYASVRKEVYKSAHRENTCRNPGSESLPEGIVANTSNLDRRPLWGYPPKKGVNCSNSLLAMPVGVKQKEIVDKMVRKFLLSEFVIMLFHYDGIVDEWKDLEWSDLSIHVSAINQTKWWFAKRFLHPDIVAQYDYIFLWDEDIGVEHFDPMRYLSIVKQEGFEISQPALDADKSEVHHPITVRSRRRKVHRRTFNAGFNGTRCNKNSKGPPCTGWIELMAPVFSRNAWRCVWYLIQNDLIHAWGLDMQLGYCAQGNRMKNIGVVDAEYVVHYGFPTLGEPENKTSLAPDENSPPAVTNLTSLGTNVSSQTCISLSHSINFAGKYYCQSSAYLLKQKASINLPVRIEVRRESFREYKIFKRRWFKAVEQDKCWKDPYADRNNV